MSDRIDHAVEAEAGIERLRVMLTPGGEAEHRALQAIIQAEATLALVEQQRIANLIALASIPKQDGYENEFYDARLMAMFEGLFDFERRPVTPGLPQDGEDDHMVMRPDIKEALGL